MNIKKYLDEFPLVCSGEGFFDIITGKSKPKDNLDAKNIKKVIQDTYLNDEWLSKFKVRTGKVRVKYANFANSSPDRGWKEEVKHVKTHATAVHKLFDELKGICESFGRVITSATVEDRKRCETIGKQTVEKLKRHASKWEQTLSPFSLAVYTELEPLTKDEIKTIAKYILGPTGSVDESVINSLGNIEDYVSHWSSSGGKYKSAGYSLIDKIEAKLGEEDTDIGAWIVEVGHELVEFTRQYDTDDFRINHLRYKEALIRYCNASLK